MRDNPDIRWEQRFSNYKRALKKLQEAVEYLEKKIASKEVESDNKNASEVLDDIIKEGLIQRFEYTFEMAWNVMKDYALFQGISEITGSRDAIRFAFSSNIISDGEMWMDMIKSRIKTSHTYNEETANEIYQKILHDYYPAFLDFQRVMEKKLTGEHKDLFDQE